MKAIRHATNNWKVDIITMSFGFPSLGEDVKGIQSAIDDAYHLEKLMFAAAKNDGANSGIAYPANQDQVICVNSTDGQGNPSKYNPSPEAGRNLSTLGEAVKSSWPAGLKNGQQRKSGTSFAAPIAAGIGAVVLDYALQNMSVDDGYTIRKLRRPQGMKAVPMDTYPVQLFHGTWNIFKAVTSCLDAIFTDGEPRILLLKF